MFDLEQSISEWRRQMFAVRIPTPVPLEELEIHLREEIQRQMESGLGELEAFEIAVRGIGEPKMLRSEFQKSEGTLEQRSFRIGIGLVDLLLGIALTIPATVQLRQQLYVVDDKLVFLLLGMFLICRAFVTFQRIIQAKAPKVELEEVEMTRWGKTVKISGGITGILFGMALILPAGVQACQKGIVEFEALCGLVFGTALLISGIAVTFSPYKKRKA